MNFLMIDGTGDPNTTVEYQQAVEALYSMAYGIKFDIKIQRFEYVVPPLEGLWWMENMNDFTLANKSRWQWTMMIMQPEWATEEIFERVRNKVDKKIKTPALKKLSFEVYQEGLAIQIVYTGKYEDEAPVIAEMHRFISENDYVPSGKHHEIYLGDPRKTAPEKLKTILRQPIRKISS